MVASLRAQRIYCLRTLFSNHSLLRGGIYGAPIVLANPGGYALGPIRMLSAPFIDGFGTPAWEMLKRRTDFILHNPEIFADNGEKGAGYRLLNELTEKLARTDTGQLRTKTEYLFD